MFRRTGWSLAGWYTVVVGLMLFVMATVLYVGERNSLLSPVDKRLRDTATAVAQGWREEPQLPCRAAQSGLDPNTYLWACFSADGSGGFGDSLARAVPAFADHAFVNHVMREGSVTDTFNSHTVLGSVRRYAVRVDDPVTKAPLGVFEIGAPVEDATRALSTLRLLLLISGVVGVVFAGIGGLFLAGRSLRPARQAYLQQQEFVANASHELRTPLTMVRADAEVLLRDRSSLNDDQVDILQDVVLEASHMASLANKMLDLARIDAGRLHMEREVVDLSEVMRGLLRRTAPFAAQTGVQVEAEDDRPALVLGDPILLEHAALILVDNAIKYNRPNGTVTMVTRMEGDRVVFEVRDTGIGIDPQHLPHLGERFYRVDKARSRESGGAGLGLSIVRGVIAQHGGTVQFHSHPGEGTVACVTLPGIRGRSEGAG